MKKRICRVSVHFMSLPLTHHVPEFQIKCWIKVGSAGVNRAVTVKSSTSFTDFKAAVANILNIREAAVELCYQFSFVKAKDIRDLTSNDDWENLVSDARKYRSKPATKRNKNEDTRSVQLKEVAELIENKGGSKVFLFISYKRIYTDIYVAEEGTSPHRSQCSCATRRWY
jgi:hypothetical protein